MKKFAITILVALSAAVPLLSACNTTEGAGKDIKSAGKGLENTARDAKQ